MSDNVESKITDTLKKFKEIITGFFDELITQFPRETDLVVVRIILKDSIPVEDVMIMFIKNLLPRLKQIKDRDEKFFISDDNFFSELDSNKVIKFKKLWKSPNLDDEDKDQLWNWIDALVIYVKKFRDLKQTILLKNEKS